MKIIIKDATIDVKKALVIFANGNREIWKVSITGDTIELDILSYKYIPDVVGVLSDLGYWSEINVTLIKKQ